MKYRKKSPTIEAFQYDGVLMDGDGKMYVKDLWVSEAIDSGAMFYQSDSQGFDSLYVKAFHYGDTKVDIGDYIINDQNGNFFIRHPVLFEREYELIKEDI